MAVKPLDQSPTVGVAELVGDILSRQLVIIEEPRTAEVTQLVDGLAPFSTTLERFRW